MDCKGVDQLRGNRTADLLFSFSHMQNTDLIMTRLSKIQKISITFCININSLSLLQTVTLIGF